MIKQFKIGTWNIGGAHTVNSTDIFDYNQEDLSYFAKILKPLNLDILCLQESHSNADNVIARRLAELLGLTYVFDSPRSPSHIDPNYQLSNAIISRYPIEKMQNILLPDPPFELYFQDGKKARLFHTYIQIAQIEGITFANTHLQPLQLFGYDWGKDEGRKLAFRTEEIFIKNLMTPIVFAGDFNAPSLYQDFPRLIESFQLKPALDEQPTDNKGKKMDYILFSSDFAVKKSELIITKESDHFLGLAELETKL